MITSEPGPQLTASQAHDMVATLFDSDGLDRVGAEVEWLTARAGGDRPDLATMHAVLSEATPRGTRLSVEPGGQIEFSTPPLSSLRDTLSAINASDAAVRSALSAHQLTPVETGLDRRRPQRITDDPRYAIMEHHFDQQGSAGRWMMSNTAALQLNLSNQPRGDRYDRWRLLHRLAPILVATFANSPGFDDHGESWASLRQAHWAAIDPCRTSLPGPGRDPVAEYLSYALNACVMLIWQRSDHAVHPNRRMSFGGWLHDGWNQRYPTAKDFSYHLTTLFPPVRPRGWLELRMIDALPQPDRDVAVAVVATLRDAAVADELMARLPDRLPDMAQAAQAGLSAPRLAAAARILLDVVAAAIADQRQLSALVSEKADRLHHCASRPSDSPPQPSQPVRR